MQDQSNSNSISDHNRRTQSREFPRRTSIKITDDHGESQLVQLLDQSHDGISIFVHDSEIFQANRSFTIEIEEDLQQFQAVVRYVKPLPNGGNQVGFQRID